MRNITNQSVGGSALSVASWWFETSNVSFEAQGAPGHRLAIRTAMNVTVRDLALSTLAGTRLGEPAGLQIREAHHLADEERSC